MNFAFLAQHDVVLADYAGEAEAMFRSHPRLCVASLRTLAEALAKQAAALSGEYVNERDDLGLLVGRLRDRGVVDGQVGQIFRVLRELGNDAVHTGTPDRAPKLITHADALKQLRLARDLSVWFHRAFRDPKFKPGPFLPPPDPSAATVALKEELERLRGENIRLAEAEVGVSEHARLRAEAEARADRSYRDVEAALALAEEATARLAAERAEFEAKLADVQARAMAATPAKREAVVRAAQTAAAAVDLDEAATRALIDSQLREAGWEADSQVLRYAKGARPVKGRNLAIAEWPTDTGPADYALFAGLVLVAVAEAKKRSVDVSDKLEQARRYAAGVRLAGDAVLAGGPWGDARVPFAFSANGRPFLEQLRTKSGVWFRDLRRLQNPSHPLVGWKSPDGLLDLLKTDIDASHAALDAEPLGYLHLYPFQVKAIRAIEKAIADGDREMLVAMATGTGKTRTGIGLVYRLIKTHRFRRVLFLVDRTTLGDQAYEAFETTTLEGFQSFTKIYDVKKLGDLEPDIHTKLQFATVQGMVRRLLSAESGDGPLPIDAYDCIIVDESHRGYHLDRELSEVELRFRDDIDYISKYRRVLDHFDAVKIGLTATPAVHTTKIFGEPIYTYTYREAVIDGYLVDHEQPYIISTKLGADGIQFAAECEAPAYNARTGLVRKVTLPDNVKFEVDAFNRDVITEPFNRAVVGKLVEELDPFGRGKTLVFAVDNTHADMLVDLLREAFRAKFEDAFYDDLVRKITAAVDNPEKLIRRYRNETDPNIAVTVDLLTTGVDVPKITTLVFMRRVNSRILFDQMRGRATRLCPEIEKESFRIYDAVGVCKAMQETSEMEPVVTNPKFTVVQLVGELSTAPDDQARHLVLEQLIAKLQRRMRRIEGDRLASFEHMAGCTPAAMLGRLGLSTPEAAAAWFSERPKLAAWLDEKVYQDRWVPISETPDEARETVQDFGGKSPQDYLTAFKDYVEANRNKLIALNVIMTRPSDLTRKQLRDLKLALDAEGYGERAVQAAWAKQSNREVAASIVGFVRQQALGSPLIPYKERVDRAVDKLFASRKWTHPQREWLTRIAAQVREEQVVDREALDTGAFKTNGGYRVLNKQFDGKLDEVLAELHAAVWEESA